MKKTMILTAAILTLALLSGGCGTTDQKKDQPTVRKYKTGEKVQYQYRTAGGKTKEIEMPVYERKLVGKALDKKEAADLAAELANDGAFRRYKVKPFKASDAVPVLKDGVWTWSAIGGVGNGDIFAKITFLINGKQAKGRIRWQGSYNGDYRK